MYSETNFRSVTKTVSWRILATLVTIIMVYIVTGKVMIAMAIGGIEVVLKIVLYFFHERFWNRVPYGKKEISNISKESKCQI